MKSKDKKNVKKKKAENYLTGLGKIQDARKIIYNSISPVAKKLHDTDKLVGVLGRYKDTSELTFMTYRDLTARATGSIADIINVGNMVYRDKYVYITGDEFTTMHKLGMGTPRNTIGLLLLRAENLDAVVYYYTFTYPDAEEFNDLENLVYVSPLSPEKMRKLTQAFYTDHSMFGAEEDMHTYYEMTSKFIRDIFINSDGFILTMYGDMTSIIPEEIIIPSYDYIRREK